MNRTLSIALILSSIVPACALRGERASMGCPTGETCSPATPMGLEFRGAAPAGLVSAAGQPLATAVGGTQTIHVTLPGGAAFTRAFEARPESASMTAVSAAPPDVTLRGVTAGDNEVRFVDPATSQLYDRVRLSVARVARVAMVPERELLPPSGAADHVNVMAGSTTALGIQLLTSGDTTLADESVVVSTVPADALGLTRTDWNSVEVHMPAAPGDVPLRVTQNGTDYDTAIRVVDSFDDFAPAPYDSSAPRPDASLAVGQASAVCFRATLGGETVLGAPWQFELSSEARLESWPAGGIRLANCALVSAAAPARATLTVTAGTVRHTYALTFVAR